MIQRRSLVPLVLLAFAVYLLIAPTEVKIRPFQGGGVSQSEQVVDFVEHIGSPSEQRQLSAESTEAALALQGQQSEPINNSTRSDRPPLLPSSERRKPTFHIVTPPNELVEYAQACSAKCLAPGFFDDAAKSGPMGRTRDAYDSTLPYSLRYTGQFAVADIFHDRVQALRSDHPETSLDDADFVYVHAEVMTELHRCGNCQGKTRSKTEAALHRRQTQALHGWLQATFKSLKGRRTYPSVFFVMSRVGDAYRKDLTSAELTALYGDDVVAMGIEPVYRDQGQYRYLQVPYPTQFHLDWPTLTSEEPLVAHWQRTRKRNTLITLMAGRIEVMSRAGTQLRQKLSQDLSASVLEARDQIYFVDTIDKWNKMYKQMSRSVFCVQPTGDTLTRRGFFDSALLGCIPVIFSDVAYQTVGSPPLHLNDLAVIIPHEDYLEDGSANLLTRLRAVPQDVIQEKQRLLAEAAPFLQYALVEGGVATGDLVEDAFGRAMRRLLDPAGF